MIWSKELKGFWKERDKFKLDEFGKVSLELECFCFSFWGFKLGGLCGQPCSWKRRITGKGKKSPFVALCWNKMQQQHTQPCFERNNCHWCRLLTTRQTPGWTLLVPDCPNNPRDWLAALTLQRGTGKVGEVELFSKSQRTVVLGLKWDSPAVEQPLLNACAYRSPRPPLRLLLPSNLPQLLTEPPAHFLHGPGAQKG